MNRVSKEAFRVWPVLPTQREAGRSGAVFYSSSERTALRRNAPVFLFRRDKSRLYGSFGSYASCRDRNPEAPKERHTSKGYLNPVNESWYILSNPGTSWFRRVEKKVVHPGSVKRGRRIPTWVHVRVMFYYPLQPVFSLWLMLCRRATFDVKGKHARPSPRQDVQIHLP